MEETINVSLESLKYKSSDELSTLLSEKEKEIMEANENLSVVNNEILYLEKKMIEVKGKLTDLSLQKKMNQLSKNKARTNYEKLQSESKIIRNAFLNVRGQGR